MIALVKLFKIPARNEFTIEKTGSNPIAILKDNILETIEPTELINLFPNNGKVFVPENINLNDKEAFKLVELQESFKFNLEHPGSLKYSIKREINNTLYEVIDIDEIVDNNGQSIKNLFQKGVPIPYRVTNAAIIRSADNKLIGPINLEFKNGYYFLKEKDLSFIPVFSQEIEIYRMADTYRGIERLFTIELLIEENIISWIDMSSNQKVINETLNILKEFTEFADLTRRLISRLKEYYASDSIIDEHLKLRLNRALTIIEQHDFNYETMESFIAKFNDLPFVKNRIQALVEIEFNNEYEKFEMQNKNLLNELHKLQQMIETTKKELVKVENRYNQKNSILSEIEKSFNSKVKQLKNDYTSVYVEQLIKSSLPSNDVVEISTINSKYLNRDFSTKMNEESSVNIENYEDVREIISNNLSLLKGRDRDGSLAALVLSAIQIGEPLIIFGNQSFDLAQVISKSLACEETLTCIPEIETFTLNDLHNNFSKYDCVEKNKCLIIHEPQLTSAVFSLPSYLKQLKWTNEVQVPNLILITVETIEDAKELSKKMPKSPLLCSDKYCKKYPTKREINQLEKGQLYTEKFETNIDFNTSALKNTFSRWLTENIEMEEGYGWNISATTIWLNSLAQYLSNEDVFKIIYEMLIVHEVFKEEQFV